MDATSLLLLNLEEVRRRSIIVWNHVPEDYLHWKPKDDAMSCIEMIRHVLEGEYLYMEMLKSGASTNSDITLYSSQPYTTPAADIAFAEPYRKAFLDLVASIPPNDLSARQVNRSDVGYIRSAGDFILRTAYHEAVHAGQLLEYLRSMGRQDPIIDEQLIWD